MKLLLLCTFGLMCVGVNAQNIIPQFDKTQWENDVRAGSIYLDADKNICELSERINVNVRIMLADNDNGVPLVFNYDFKDPADAPWKINSFKIVSGGAQVGVTDGFNAQIVMPSAMPTEKAVLVQATLDPVDKSKPQVQVFTTIYLQDNDNVFYFNCPYWNIDNEKYVVKNNGGAFKSSDAAVKTAMKKNIATANPAIKKYSMLQPAAGIAASERGLNIDALTGNAKAIYVQQENITSVILNSDYVEMENGLKTTRKRMYMIALTVPGKSTGTFKIRSDKKITATITLPQVSTGVGCSCSEDPDDPNRTPPTCAGGTITIAKNDGKFIEGTVIAHLESQDASVNPPVTYYSKLVGKFKVPWVTGN